MAVEESTAKKWCLKAASSLVPKTRNFGFRNFAKLSCQSVLYARREKARSGGSAVCGFMELTK